MAAKNGTILSHPHDACHLAFDFRSVSKLPAANALPLPQVNPGSPTISRSTCQYPLHPQNQSRWIWGEGSFTQGIVENRSWKIYTKMIPKNKIMSTRIAVDEIESRRQVEASG